MLQIVSAVLLVLGVYVAVLPGSYTDRPHYPDHPLPGHTGGFGEPSCHTCHFDYPLNDPAGHLTVDFTASEDDPGSGIITVTLVHPAMERAGFQATVRTRAGQQNGSLHALDERTVITELDSIQYVHHTLEGTELIEEGRATWQVRWAAPDRSDGPVLLHVAANAANNDASEFGDFIFTGRHRFNPGAE